MKNKKKKGLTDCCSIKFDTKVECDSNYNHTNKLSLQDMIKSSKNNPYMPPLSERKVIIGENIYTLEEIDKMLNN